MVKEEEQEDSGDEESNSDSDIGGGEIGGEEEYAGKEENSFLSYPETALINKVILSRVQYIMCVYYHSW